MVRKIIIMLGMAFILSGCGQMTDWEMERVVAKGDVVVDALMKYHEEHNKYPDSLNELVPSYLDSIPKFDNEISSDPYYMKIPKEHENEYYFGFKIAIYDNKKFMVIGAKATNLLIYYPSENYPQRKFTTVHKRVGRWAYQTSYRTHNKPNPVISD